MSRVPSKSIVSLADQLRATFEASRESVQRAHDRAEQAAERARRMRAEARRRQEAMSASGVAKRKLSLAEAESASALRESERFVAVVSHELRQPLNAAMAAMALIEDNAGTDVGARARGVLQRQLIQMSSLLDDLLDMSRLTLQTLRLNRAAVDARLVLGDAVETVESDAERSGVHVYVDMPQDPALVIADVGRLRQAFSNLLTNAVRYTPRGGAVHISAAVTGLIVTITVADTGQGIASGDLANIFEPFWRGGDSGSKGFGIGLALVRGIVELHGGAIAAFSEGRGMGSRFCLTLPLSQL
jgi:signal transduction histidine kinase